ncbi:DUF4397 domain-containing protein [Mucilaginibacter glaciei]|uniref:DUF4397 domain-containing protein n=1 Tax=Mucilaginibacter glaciei TaxID=2772109 RepID=A0A926NQM2_9SPHI|nr:DUF4397 domain-containing protein [Mucilaginibacter glaciei]MBD1392900.1 DUF4397 domain-containing protein [Mucilaginibacter glaciei]
MKKTIYIAFGLLLATVAGCKKNSINQISDMVSGAQIKFIHVAPGVPALNGFANNTKLSLTQSVSVTDNGIPISIATGYTYLGVFPASNYSSVASGSTAIRVDAATPIPALKSAQIVAPAASLGSVTQATVDGGAYSVFTIGLPGSTTAPLTNKVVEDKFPAAAKGKAYIRFANMVPNGGAYDLVGTYTPTGGTAVTATISTGTTYTNLTDFIAVDVNAISTTGYIFQMKLGGTATNFGTALGTSTTPTQLTPGRYYTVIGRGLAADYPVPGTSIILRSTARPTVPASTLPEIYFNAAGLTLYTNK